MSDITKLAAQGAVLKCIKTAVDGKFDEIKEELLGEIEAGGKVSAQLAGVNIGSVSVSKATSALAITDELEFIEWAKENKPELLQEKVVVRQYVLDPVQLEALQEEYGDVPGINTKQTKKSFVTIRQGKNQKEALYEALQGSVRLPLGSEPLELEL